MARAKVSPVTRPDAALPTPGAWRAAIGVEKIDERNGAVSPIDAGRGRVAPVLQRNARLAHTHVEDAGIADHDNARYVVHAPIMENAGRLFRTNPGAIARRKGDDGSALDVMTSSKYLMQTT